MRDFVTVAKEYIAKRREQSGVAEQHLRLGIQHAKLNKERVMLEEELLKNFARRDYTAEDGTRVVVGTEQSRLHDRVKIITPEVASTCECAKVSGLHASCPKCRK